MMSADGIEIRRLTQEDPTDAVLYRGIRLEALQANPEAFGSTLEVENAQPLSWFSDRLGGSTVEAICNLARQHVELIQLTVVRDNEQARSLYVRLGFLEYGVEKNALKQDGRYYDEVLMAKDLLG
jgi:Acetyltransferase (GNAT) domain